MSSPQKTCLLYLFGLFLLCSGVLANSKILDLPQIVVQTRESQNYPELYTTRDVTEQQANGTSTYPEQYRVGISQAYASFTGIRSVFQWTVGKVSNIGGIHNALDFSIKDTVRNQSLIGQIGIYSNGSRIGVHLSLDSVNSSTPGTNFTCSNNFTFINGNHACFNSNYTLISNAIYYLDVEIQNNTVLGYISEPQRNRTNINVTNLRRTLIGEMNWKNGLTNLQPEDYWVANSFGDSCKNLSDISTFNYPPVSYTNLIREKTSFYTSMIMNTTNCGPQNVLSLTSFSPAVAIYIARPPAQLNDAKSVNY